MAQAERNIDVTKEEILIQYLVENQARFYRLAYSVLKDRDEALDAVQTAVCHALGLSLEEIAQALEVDLGTVKSRISRARRALRKILLERGNLSGYLPSKQTEKEGRS